MPPGHGHGGGHGGGGHHGGHHHGGGGPGGWQGGWGPGWSGPGYWGAQPAYAELVVPSCPDTIDQVLASDGRTYLNACLANQAGARVVRHLSPPTKLAGMPEFTKSQPFRIAQFAAGLAMAYHGYKRNDSILWGLLWGATGLAGVPFALVQGFGEPKKKPGPRTTAQTVARVRTLARTRR